MLAKLTSKNQLTLPKKALEALGPVTHFEVEVEVEVEGEISMPSARYHKSSRLEAAMLPKAPMEFARTPLLRAAILAAGCLLLSDPALADNFDGEMTFQYYTVTNESHAEVQADGVITEDTPQEFSQFLAAHDVPAGSDVYFTSGGGNLDAGLRLGRLIREKGLDTVVGAHTAISNETISFLQQQYGVILTNLPFEAPLGIASFRFSSYCASSCTFAFLGGVHRYIGLGSIYAVHKFNVNCEAAENKNLKICRDPAVSRSDAQKQSADLAVYLEQMGIPESFLEDMVLAEPDKLNVLSCEQLKKYHIFDATIPNLTCGF